MPGNLLCGLEIGVESRFLDVGALRRPRRVGIDGDQGFGGVDDDASAGRQLHRVLESGFDLAFNLVAAEQRDIVGVQLDATLVVRHHLLDEGLGFAEGFLAIDQQFADILAQAVPYRAHHEVVLLVDQRRGATFIAGALDRLPELQQVVNVPLQFFVASTDAGGAYDHAHSVGNLELAQRFAQRIAVVALDAAGNAAGPRVVGHEHHVTPGKAEKRSQRGTLGPAFLLVDLDEEFLSLANQVRDFGPAGSTVIIGFARLDIASGNLLQWQESVAVGPEFNKRRFEARLDPGHSCAIDAAFLLFAPGALYVEIVQALSIHNRDAHLFGLRRIDEHAFHSILVLGFSPRTRRQFDFS